MKKVKVKLLTPISAAHLFENVTNKIKDLNAVILTEDSIGLGEMKQTEKREWHPEDRIVPPNCAYTDIKKNEWRQGSFYLLNFMSQHSRDDRLMDSGGRAFFSIYKNDQLYFNIECCENNLDGFWAIEFSALTSDLSELKIKLMNLLDLTPNYAPYPHLKQVENEPNNFASPSYANYDLNIRNHSIDELLEKILGQFPQLLDTVFGETLSFENNGDSLTFDPNKYHKKEIIEIEWKNKNQKTAKIILKGTDESGIGFTFSYAIEGQIKLKINGNIDQENIVSCVYIEQLIEKLPENITQQSKVYNSLKNFFNVTNEEVINRFKRLVNVHHQEQKNLQFYADSMKILPVYLNNLFLESHDINAQSFIEQIRLKQIKIILASSAETYDDIATTFGFRDSRDLNHYFTKKVGFSLSFYKKNFCFNKL